MGTPPVPGTHRCNDKGGSILDRSPDFLRKSVEDNLQRLGLERMAIVPLRGFIHFIAAQRAVADQAKLPSELAASLVS